MDGTCRYLEQLLHQDIPLTQALGLGVSSWDGSELHLSLPLAANLNHKSSMFGGSLYCGAVLAGWGWLHLRLREAGVTDGHIVIQQGQIDYLQPVLGDALAVCTAPPAAQWDKFLALYRRRGLARISLHSRILADEAEAVRFSGQYVLHR
ncbi:thioesterase domain-containing protein [Aquipseudomonas guryensis]|uniref:YiiD C-terminal domain-containing protein n=1 Tax=Aquipseudomonas guryensis TaxID=2759165 RepID=A0A7W4H2Z7_9GAMM|nr:thioesterase domain-containing protein [Pseudomonas guryensis]MBB1518904.1 YiiD C-terminal domain-containing protein [Pseudomonas guryensis]